MGYKLIIDTSNRMLSVGIADDYKVIYKKQYEAWQRQSEFTIKEIDIALKSLKILPSSLDEIIVGKGPGSYTGIRIALTIGKVMSYALNIPLKTISSLQTLCGLLPKCMAIIDARSDRTYVGIYDKGKAIIKDSIQYLSDIPNIANENGIVNFVGEVNLIGKEVKDIDIVENMYLISKLIAPETNVNVVTPQYLKG